MNTHTNNYKLLNELNININTINLTHNLDKFEGIKYKFGGSKYYPDFYKTDQKLHSYVEYGWQEDIQHLVENILQDGITYSIAVLGTYYENGKLDSITFGEHLLVTNKIDVESLIIYLEGQIDSTHLSIESGRVVERAGSDLKIQFKYREISISREVYDSASKIKHSEKLETKEDTSSKDLEFLSKIHNNKNILKFLNIIPLTSDFTEFGEITNPNHISRDGKFGVLYTYNSNIEIFIYDHKDNKYSGIIYKKGYEYSKFKDTIVLNNSSYNLIRMFGNNSIFVNNGSIVHMDTEIKSKQIKQGKRSITHNTKHLTFDIECYLDENKEYKENKTNNQDEQWDFIPYSCGWYSKDEHKIYISTEYNSWQDMISQFFTDIENKYKDYTIRIHNFSSFDSLYMLKTLYKKYKTNPLFKDGKVISLNLSSKNKKDNKFKLFIKDSLKLLPLSLEKLIKGFNIETKKLLFPYKFVNKDNLDYTGSIPTFDYYTDNGLYDKSKHERYLEISKEFKNKPWNLIEETKKYLYNDIKSLYEILEKFSKDVYNVERINISDVVSISSLALKTFLTNYYDSERTPIHIPKYKQYKDIKNAYFGGRTEVLKTYGEDLYIYDVNSLYSSVMLKDIPIGNLIKSSDTNLDNYFGFCYVTVDVPEYNKNPVLPFRDNLGNIYNPTGNWTGWYSSEILKIARDIDKTKITVHYGYKLKKGENVFTNFINHYFDMKRKAEQLQNDGLRMLAKLMLNSLYGRFGLKYTLSTTKIVSSSEFKELSLKHKVLDSFRFDEENDLEYIRYSKEPSDIIKNIDVKLYNKLISKEGGEGDFITRSLPISAMITSYASSFMHPFLNLPDNECYYTDTDSLVLKHPLDPKYVGDGLGQFKLVGKIKRAYFISPKLYCLILENGDTIIKSKGVDSKHLTEQDFIEMLYGCNKLIPIHRFVKDFKKSIVHYEKSTYLITPQILKRNVIYENGLIINTKPYHVKDGVLIKDDAIKLNHNLIKYNPNQYAITVK
jgi:hypothetical protein